MRRRGIWGSCVLFTISLGMVVPAASPALGASLSVDVDGSNGVGRATSPALSCAEGGYGPYRHYGFETPVAPGVMSKLPGTLRSSLDVHYEEPAIPLDYSNVRAFLLGTESHATISNSRGAVQMRLSSGDCLKPPLTFDGETAAGSGTWSILSTGGSGAYRKATGSGTFTLNAGLAPGADNPWSLQMSGTLNVLKPSLPVPAWNAYWGNLGLDYVSRIVSIDFAVRNGGPGDSYNVRLTKVTSSTSGVKVLTGMPIALGDLMEGESEIVTIRYQLGLLSPCMLVILSCKFSTTLTVEMPDALDIVASKSTTVYVKAPDLPPPL